MGVYVADVARVPRSEIASTWQVICSSMGGTQPENFLNSIGKGPDGSGAASRCSATYHIERSCPRGRCSEGATWRGRVHVAGGDILLWKRKAEKYAVGLGVDYTIVHPVSR